MRFTISTVALGFVAAVSAVAPITLLTTELAIGKPGLAEIVPAGKVYTITWAPDYLPTKPVDILLLHGPSSNVVPFGAPIASGVPNSGSFAWDVATTIPPESTHYGLQIIAADGSYQFSVQFGISNPAYSSASSKASSAAVTSAASSAAESKSASAAAVTTSCSTSNATSYKPTGTAYSSHFSASTGYPVSNSSIVLPSKSMTVPSSLLTTATGAASSAASAATTAPAQATGAAAHVKAGLGLAGAIAGLVMVL